MSCVSKYTLSLKHTIVEVTFETKILPFVCLVVDVLDIVVDILVSLLADFNGVENAIIVEASFLDVGLDVDLDNHFVGKLSDVDIDINVEFPVGVVAVDVDFSVRLLLNFNGCEYDIVVDVSFGIVTFVL